MNTLDAIRTKRSVRQFEDVSVPEQTINEILNAGRCAQSSKNDQPWTFLLIQGKESLKALSEFGTYAGHISGAAFAVVLVDHNNWSFDIGQAAAYMQLAAWDLGVSSCLAYFGSPDKVKALLGIPKNVNVEIGISFGYPAKEQRKVTRLGRKPLDEVVRKEHW